MNVKSKSQEQQDNRNIGNLLEKWKGLNIYYSPGAETQKRKD